LRFLATCNPGTEDVAAEEVEEEVYGGRVLEVREYGGRVIFEADGPWWLVLDQALSLRSIHSLVLLLSTGRIGLGREGLEEAWRITYESGVDEYIPYMSTFAVESQRMGEGHEYTSVDLASVVGDAVSRAVMDRRGWRPLVRLNSPQVVVYAEAEGEEFRVGVVVGGERSMHRRRYRVYDHPAALKATLAYVMLRLSGARDGDTILDPMCGGGTMAIEAALLFESSRIICIDRDRVHVEGARLNAASARVGGRVEVIHGDARRLTEILGRASVDVVASNPPYGIRLGDPVDVRGLYMDFMPQVAGVLRSGGRAVIITAEPGYLDRAAARAGLEKRGSRRVRHGDLWVEIAVYERP